MSQVIEITRNRGLASGPQVSLIEAGEICPDDVAAIIRTAAGDPDVTRVRVLTVEPERERGAENVGEHCVEAGPPPEHVIELHFRSLDERNVVAEDMARHDWRALFDTRFYGSGYPVRLNGPGTPEALELLNAWITLLRLRGRLIEDRP